MKRIVSLILALLMFISVVPPLNVSASQNENARYGERYVYTVIDSTTVTANLKVDGQTNGGNAFADGGGLIINPNGGLIQSISVSLSGKSFSISVTPGRISTTPKATDVYVEFPKDSIRRYVYCMRDYLVEYLFVEEYRGTELISTFYTTRTTLLGTTWYTKPA